MPSDNASGADNQQERLHEYWIVGFVDGEGCFSVSCNRNPTTKLGYQIFPEFVVTQGEKSLETLKDIQKFFGCGRIFVNRRKDNHREPIHRYCVRSIRELSDIIIPFFERHPLRTAKRKDFDLFCEAVTMMQDGQHLQRQGIETIILLKSRMNRKKMVQIAESSETTCRTP